MNIALITAGGTGNRMGQDIPKQFMTVDNIPVIIYTLLKFQRHPDIDMICTICLQGWEVMLRSYANQFNITKLKYIFDGGMTNQESIENGINGLKENGCSDKDIILIHDGVRPLISKEIISNNISTCKEFGFAVTGMICKEAIMKKVDNCVESINIPREILVRTQTPHTYYFKTLFEAYKTANAKKIKNTVAPCMLFAELGENAQHLVQGSEKNGLKLTHTEDIELFKALKNATKDDWLK